MSKIYDVIVIGAGQSGLACGYYLNRTELDYLILDENDRCGGAWLHTWDSLTLFSPSEFSSLPGWMMPKSENKFPTREEVIAYLCRYEERYKLPIERPVKVLNVEKEDGIFKTYTDKGEFHSKTIIAATGTYGNRFIPEIKGREKFKGIQLHSAEYKKPEVFEGEKVLIVGEGNSGAQILSEVSKYAETKWATKSEPKFLPDDVDGRVLFNVATAKYKAKKEGKQFDPKNYNLGNIVMVPPVIEARERGVLKSNGNINEIYEDGVIWDTGKKEDFDTIIWCTGFNYSTEYLNELVDLNSKGKAKTNGTRSEEVEGLWFMGFGGWTGYASATLIGVGRYAKSTVKEIEEYVG